MLKKYETWWCIDWAKRESHQIQNINILEIIFTENDALKLNSNKIVIKFTIHLVL